MRKRGWFGFVEWAMKWNPESRMWKSRLWEDERVTKGWWEKKCSRRWGKLIEKEGGDERKGCKERGYFRFCFHIEWTLGTMADWRLHFHSWSPITYCNGRGTMAKVTFRPKEKQRRNRAAFLFAKAFEDGWKGGGFHPARGTRLLPECAWILVYMYTYPFTKGYMLLHVWRKTPL